jgi:hypothetical protein
MQSMELSGISFNTLKTSPQIILFFMSSILNIFYQKLYHKNPHKIKRF